jgi:hypothetical protein
MEVGSDVFRSADLLRSSDFLRVIREMEVLFVFQRRV